MIGRPCVISKEEEDILAERILIMGDWGFPLSLNDVAHFIKEYLDCLGRVTRFPDNLPGKNYLAKFLQRYPSITRRRANNIKRSRARVSPEIVKEFFTNYSEAAAGIPGSNIFNYDETNLTNDPGKF